MNIPEEKMEEYIEKIKDLSRDELRAELKRVKADKEKPLMDTKYSKKLSTIKINEVLTEEQFEIIKQLVAEKLSEFKK